MSFGSAVAERSQKGESPGHEVVSPPVKVGGESLVQRDASRTAVSLMQSGTGSDGVRRERTPAEIEAEIKRDHKIRQEHLSSSLSGKILVSGEDPRPKGLREAHEELEKDDLFWMKYLLGGSSALQSFLNDVLGGTRLLHFQVLEATIRDQDFFLPWADRLDNMVAVIMLAQRVWFEGNWANGYLKQATSWSDLSARMTAQMASAGSGSSTAGLQAMQARLNGLQALAGLGRGVRSGSAMASVRTVNDGWKTAPEPPATAHADATKSGGQSSGTVASNYTATQEATRAATIAKLNSPPADQHPENATSQVERKAQFVANNHQQGDPELQRDVNYSERVLAENRNHAYNADVKSHLIGQDKVNATMENEENPLPEDTYQRLLAIWRDGFWLQNPPDHAELVKLQKILSYAGSMFNHQQLVLHRDLPRVGPGVEREAEVMHMQMHFTTYKMQVNDQYHNVVDARYWLDHWKRRLELAAAFWGGEKGAWVRKTFPNAKSAQDVEAGIASLVKQQTDNKQGWFFGLHLSDEQQSAVYSLQKVSEELHYFSDYHKSGGKTFRLEWWGRPSGASAA